MIEIIALLDKNGVIRDCKVSGHAKAGKAGNDIVCAAVSVLVRTAVNVLSNRKGITIHYNALEKGQLYMEVSYEAEGKDFLYAAGVFLIEGLKSVAQEYPKNCTLTVKEI
ncbi:MAG: ribosomal-processing cysteine protease Prp [Treponema sp.]|nr:ribosomal-processing cysteine protease Prp [Treponema sp.]